MNAHIHLPPNFSAFARAEDAADQARSEGLVALGFSNYYDFSVYASAVEACLDRRIYPILGTEILAMHEPYRAAKRRLNDPVNPGKAYVCGKGIARLAPIAPRAAQTLRRIREGDDARMAAIASALSEIFAESGANLELTAGDIRMEESARCGAPAATITLQERHLARSFQQRLFERVPLAERTRILALAYGDPPTAEPGDAAGVQAEIRSKLMKAGRPAYAPEPFIGLEDSITLVKDLGGIPAYPVVADGASPIGEFEATPDVLVENLKSLGIEAVEFIPGRNHVDVLAAYVDACRNAGLVVTAGTEHNTLGCRSLVPRCLGDVPVPSRTQEAFWEGATVVAAHQARALRDESGFGACPVDVLRDEGERLLSGVAHG